MAKITDDILEGASGTIDYLGWKEFTRIMIVSEISLATTGWLEKVAAALAASGLVIGAQHPTYPAMFLSQIQPEGLANDTIKLTCSYNKSIWKKPPQFEDDAIEVGASIASVETNKDKNNVEMFLKYTYPVGYQRSPHDDPLTAEKIIEVGHLTNKPVADLTWSKNKIENSSPESKAENYVSKVNSSSWRGYPVKTWLCTRIYGRSTDGGETYNVTYDFQYRPDNWDHTAIFIKDDGKPPKETDGDSKKTYSLLKEANFNNLNL